MSHLWLKAFHVIAIITWMAGLLYFWRLLVYHAMETEQVVKDRLIIMQRKLRRAIMNPGMVVSLVLGISMLINTPSFMSHSWVHLKLLLVLGLVINHGMAVRMSKKLEADSTAYNHKHLRILNEVPTLLMIGIVLLVVLKPQLW